MKKSEKLLKMSDYELDKKVHIGNTDLDRHVKMSSKDIAKATKLVAKGEKLTKVASQFGVTPSTIRYRTDEEYKKTKNALRKNYINNRITVCDFDNRVAYKRQLILEGKIK